MNITYKVNTDNPASYHIYSREMMWSENHIDECTKIIDMWYMFNGIKQGIIEIHLGTDMDIKEGVDAIVYHSDTQDRWQIRNRKDIKYSGDIAIKMQKSNGDPDEIYYTTATHYLTVYWNANDSVHSINIVNMQQLQQHVLSNIPHYNSRCINSNSRFYPMPYNEWKEFSLLHWKKGERQ